MKRIYSTPMKTPMRQRNENKENKESLQVYCRIKPIAPEEQSCIKIISDTTVQLTVQDNSSKSGKQYTFKRVFTEAHTQKDVFDDVGLPLVEQLISGKNGLLFTYGVTGSGKTFTMTGKKNSGVMPRCLDVLFNSINDFQAQKFIFKPDRMNGFEIQSEDEAERDREDFLRMNKLAKLKKNNSQEDLLSARSKDGTKVTVREEDNAYAVFITYIEVYNNFVYDLLDSALETDICRKPQSKILREDGAGNMYVHGITEVEVKSTEEAFEMFYKGEKRKRMGRTVLNSDSSRSHSVFTIRLVQAPLDVRGETVLQDKQKICISQLSLVDLAGSERTNRTKNTGQRLNEAGKINQSLMVLRQCLETLRDNQQTGRSNKVPYREQKVTNLFKNFFEGDGDIRMIVCVNPSTADADENVFVMQFAEASQDIMVKPTPLKSTEHIGLTPGRRRLNMEHKRNLQMLEEIRENQPASYVPIDAKIIYNFGSFPQREAFSNDEDYNKAIRDHLEDVIKKREIYLPDLESRRNKFRAMLTELVEKVVIYDREKDIVHARQESDEKQNKSLREKLVSLDSEINTMKRKLEEQLEENRAIKIAKRQLEEQVISRERKYEEMKKENKRLKRELANIKPIITNENEPPSDECSTPCTQQATTVVSPTKSASSIAVSNPRYNKVHHDARDQWLDHRPTLVTPLNTVLQPVLRKRKSFDNVTSPKEVRKTSKYCLMTQNQNDEGDVETQFYKGDVVPTVGGGAQVILNDVETLKQSNPMSSPTSPVRRQGPLYPDIEGKCAVSVEGHPSKRKC